MSSKLNINVKDSIKAREILVKYKPWFNGVKKFTSVHLKFDKKPR